MTSNDVNAEFLRKFPVALIVRRNCHDCARAVTHHYIVGNIDRNIPCP